MKKFLTSDKIVSFSAIFISLLTLIIFIRQTNIIEKQSRLSAMPYLMLETSNNAEDNQFFIDVVNHGVGPAIITKRTIIYKNKTYNMEFYDFLRTHIPEMDSVEVFSASTIQEGLSIPAGKIREVLKVGGGEKSYLRFMKIMENLQSEDNGFDYEIEYRSIYNDYWKIDGTSDVPEEL